VIWSELVNKPLFNISDRGFFGISITLNFKDKDGIPHKTFSNGYIFMHVVKKEYLSLLENEEDENFVWSWKTTTNQIIKMTTGARVFVSTPRINSEGNLLNL
jgi:hypothetical protein